MKKFNFKFQKLLDVRSHREKEEQEKFAVVLGEYVAVQNIIGDAAQKRKQVLDESRAFMESGNLQLFHFRDRAREGLKCKSIHYNKILKEKEIPLNAAREKLVEAMKKKKVMEILKDKAKSSYIQEVVKEEQNELDDFGGTIFLKHKKID